ncbi:hypothetical protein Tco_1547108 [Tanacetum coccineum]
MRWEECDAPNKHPDLKTNRKPIDKEDHVFLDELERLKRQEKDANNVAEALRKEFAQQTEDLLLQAGAAKPSSTNIVNTASTPFLVYNEPKQSTSEALGRLKVGVRGYAGENVLLFKDSKVWHSCRFDLWEEGQLDDKLGIKGKTQQLGLWKSTTGGCQFLGRRLISWQCKKQTIVATSTTEAEYVAAANCCGQVLWIQNQMLDYGFNFMNTKIYIDNESTICIVKNPVYHSKTKHIAIRHHFIRDAYEKKLIQVLKIHTDDNVADLLTKAFDVSRFQFLVVTIGMINP